MTPFLAMLRDTWRQSIHQWVLLMLIAIIVLFTALIVIMTEVRQAPDGSEFVALTYHPERAQAGFEAGWQGVYADSLKAKWGYNDQIDDANEALGDSIDAFEDVDFRVKRLEAQNPDSPELQELINQRRNAQEMMDQRRAELSEIRTAANNRVNEYIDRRTAEMTKLEKGVERWMSEITAFLFTISMLGFIAACSMYVPNMVESGSIDLVLSKPVRRWHVYFGKYVGGLLLYSLVLVAAFVIIFLGIGAKTGVWHFRFLAGIPMTIFALALLFSIIAWVGLWTRSTAMAMVIGYVYYLVVDTAIGHLDEIGGTPFLANIPGLKQMAAIVEYIFPSFVWLRESAESTSLSVLVFPWHHVIVGMIWLIICLGTSYNRFRINDY